MSELERFKEERQMQAYIQWVNSQLRKRPGSRVVDDLQSDMNDGVAFLQLIEVVGNEKVSIIENPLTAADMATNVTHVLRFMAERKIKMHQINSKEIVEGNRRAIMRLILALAAHFKPGSVRPTGNNSDASYGKLERASSTMSLAAEAAVALADASKMASSAGLSLHYKYKKRPNFDTDLSPSEHGLHQVSVEATHSRSSSSASSASYQSLGNASHSSSTLPRMRHKNKGDESTPKKYLHKTSSDTDNRSFLTPPSGHQPILRRVISDDSSIQPLPRKMKNVTSRSAGNSRKSSRPSSAGSNTSCDDHMLAVEHDHLVTDAISLKEQLLELQQTLLKGEILEDDNNNKGTSLELALEGASLHEQVVILNARLDQASRDYQILKNNTSTLKEESVKLQGEKTGLQARLTQLEQANINLRSDQLRQELACDSARSAKESAQKIIDERERQITELHEELASKDQIIENQRREIEQLMDTLEGRENTEADRDTQQMHLRGSREDELRFQIEELTGRLGELSDSETQINSQIDHYNRRLKRMEETISRSQHTKEAAREYDKAYHTLENLRTSFGKHDPRQHALDSIGQSLSTMIENVSISTSTPKNDSKSRSSSKKTRSRLNPRERIKNNNTPLKQDMNSSNQNGFLDDSFARNATKKTKVLYFIEQSITPYLASIPKSLGEITLRDFKMLLDRGGSYRYFFKSVDPDFGSVKTELVTDDSILPGWDGKIVSWVEDDKELGPEFQTPLRSYVVKKETV